MFRRCIGEVWYRVIAYQVQQYAAAQTAVTNPTTLHVPFRGFVFAKALRYKVGTAARTKASPQPSPKGKGERSLS